MQVETKGSNRKRNYPKPTEHVIAEKPFTEKVKDSTGKTRVVKGKNQTTVPGSIQTLHKIGEMIFVSPETKEIVLIPFTIKFTFEQFFMWLTKMQKNLQVVIDDWSKDQPDEQKN